MKLIGESAARAAVVVAVVVIFLALAVVSFAALLFRAAVQQEAHMCSTHHQRDFLPLSRLLPPRSFEYLLFKASLFRVPHRVRDKHDCTYATPVTRGAHSVQSSQFNQLLSRRQQRWSILACAGSIGW